MPDLVRVFISYSHDSEAHRDRVRELAARLRSDGVDAWMDQYSAVPAEGWPRWTVAEFTRADFILIACSTGYAERFNRGPGHGSGVGWEAVLICQELYDKGGLNTRFIPILFDGDEGSVPLVLRPFTRHLLPAGYGDLLRHLTNRLQVVAPALGAALPAATLHAEGARQAPAARRTPWNAPSLPDQYLPREELDAFKVSLIGAAPQAIAVAGQHHRLGFQGMPGVGKTLLAAALAWDPEVQDAFAGGVFWLTLGRTPDPPARWQAELAGQLKGAPVEIDTPRLGRAKLAELFAARPPSLLILDDVWRVEDAEPFNALVSPSRLLITTRNRDVAAGLGATVRELLELKATAGLALLAAYADRPVGTLPRMAPEIVRECGELPLALAMAGAMLRGRPDDRWPTLLAQLQKADLAYLAAALPDYSEHRNMLAAIEVSVQELPEDVRRRFLDFAVFAEDVAVPEAVVHRLWRDAGVDLAAAQKTVDALVDRSLVRRDAQGRLTLHDLQHDYLRAHGGDIEARHARLLASYRNTTPDRALHAVGSDGYFFEQVARHVRDGEGAAALRALLFDHRWLAAKLNATGVNALLADFELLDLASDPPLRLLRDALRLSGHVLARHPEELSFQLLGRLRDAPETELQHFCARLEADVTLPALLPVWPRLKPPGEPLRRTLEGHTGRVRAVALNASGKTAVSGSYDKTLQVWDVGTGRWGRTLRGHGGPVNAVALSADGKTAVSGSEDHTLKVWDVETGDVRRTLEGHAGWVNAVALSADGKTVLSGSHDGTVKVWDVRTGQVHRTLVGRAGAVNAVALSADGKTAVSGADKTLKVWDVDTGHVRRTLEGHASWVNAVALSADGKTAVSGSSDGTVEVWDVETSEARRTLKGHAGGVTAVALSADETTAVSGSHDGTVKVWDLEADRVRLTLEGHAGGVAAVALSADGTTAVSGSSDATVKVWDVKTSEVRRTLEGHAGGVKAVALSADGKTAVSNYSAEPVQVWDVETGQVRRTLENHGGWVNAVALSADGRTVVSGFLFKTVKVGDVETGRVRRTLEGHDTQVNAVALSADGKTAISGCDGGMVRVWDAETGRVLHTLKGGLVNAVALSANGKTAAASFGAVTTVWDIETGGVLHALEGHAGRVIAVALSADGKRVVSGSHDSTVKVWDVETGRVLRTLKGHASFVNAVALSADGKTVVSGSFDKTIKAWDVKTGRCVASFMGEAAFTTLALSQTMRVFAGDSAGHVHLLELRLGPDQARGLRS